MTSLRRSNKQSLMAVIVIMATMTMTLVQAETTGALSAPIRDCLNEFRRLRDEAYSSHHLSEVVFCKNSAGQTKGHDNGEEANRNLRYAQEHGLAGDKEAAMNALRTNNYLWTTEIVVLMDKLTDPTCNVFMRDIIGKLDMKQMKKNERQLRQKIDELHLSSGSGSSSGEGGDSTRTIVLGDDFYPYCQLMSFSEPEKLIEHVHGLLNNKRWASKEYERLFEPVQRLNNIISSYRRAQTGRPERKSQLAEEFSVNVRWRMNNKDDRFLAASIKGGFAGIEHDHGLGSLWSKHGVEAALDVMRRRYGRDKSSRIIAKRVGKELKPACNAFVNRFKHVFEGFYIKRDAKKTLKTIADRQHLKEVQEFTKGLHTYLCCYLITKGDPGNRFLKQIKSYDAPALDDGDDHLERANGIDGEFETHVTGEDSAEPEDTGMETGKFGSKHERDENDENDEIVD